LNFTLSCSALYLNYFIFVFLVMGKHKLSSELPWIVERKRLRQLANQDSVQNQQENNDMVDEGVNSVRICTKTSFLDQLQMPRS
jgi:hypothetical protein